MTSSSTRRGLPRRRATCRQHSARWWSFYAPRSEACLSPSATASCTAARITARRFSSTRPLSSGLQAFSRSRLFTSQTTSARSAPCCERQPQLPQVACFDTAFHRGHPEIADRYALPEQLYQEGVRRYGFHGLSYEYIASQLPKLAPDIAQGPRRRCPSRQWRVHVRHQRRQERREHHGLHRA